VHSLLNPDNSPCIELTAGILIASPDPVLSDDVIEPFNVLEMGSQEIENAKPFPPIIRESDDWQPFKADYEEIKDVWNNPEWGVIIQKVTIMQWVSSFSSIWGLEEEEADLWTAGMPEGLQDEFESWYIGAPMLLRV
jgi:hypothetical protein